MYRAKQAGRNAYQFYTAEINQRSRARAQMGSELRRALEREEFALVYQPKYLLASRRVRGAEALLRWNHPERGVVSPAEFIPVLEETGLIVPVGEWVILRACEDIKAWQAAGLQSGPVSVNLSARQFRQQDLDARIRSLVAAAGVDSRLIELEITESHLMQDPDHAIRVMRALCDAGMRIAIDDFGTGYSSLAYLTRFPVSSLKIDRSFIKDMANDKNDATIVRTIIEMAHSLGFTVVAEGVETEEQATFLRLLRCGRCRRQKWPRSAPDNPRAHAAASGFSETHAAAARPVGAGSAARRRPHQRRDRRHLSSAHRLRGHGAPQRGVRGRRARAARAGRNRPGHRRSPPARFRRRRDDRSPRPGGRLSGDRDHLGPRPRPARGHAVLRGV
jgi:EAL domain-containing protein (putative c-di-GMP-specific phosphodiesterase class I)